MRGVVSAAIRELNLFLGHGRALESYLGAAALIWGIELLLPIKGTRSVALYDLPMWVVGVSALTAGGITLAGVILNGVGIAVSRQIRMVGAVLSILLWTWLTIKCILVDSSGILGFPFVLLAAPAALRALYLASLNLPVPGAPGRWR